MHLIGGMHPDRAVVAEILKAAEAMPSRRRLRLPTRTTEQYIQWQQALSLQLKQPQNEARLAARRYEAVDPENRLIAAKLEKSV